MMTRFLALARSGSFRRHGAAIDRTPVPRRGARVPSSSSTFSVMLLVLVACGDPSLTPPRRGSANCTVGASARCACADGRLGAQTCTANHTFGECMCTGMPVEDGGMRPGLDSGGMQPGLDSGGMQPGLDS